MLRKLLKKKGLKLKTDNLKEPDWSIKRKYVLDRIIHK
jgi:hypothetical protein